MQTTSSTLGDLILALYDEYQAVYNDADLASVAAAATINELLAEAAQAEEDLAAA